MIQRVRDDIGMPREERMDGPTQVADAFAVNDADLQNTPFPARSQIIRHEVFYLAGLERVQVQHAVNRQRHRFVVSVHKATITQARLNVELESCGLSREHASALLRRTNPR